MAQGVKKINEARFAEIKQHIIKHGIESATAKWPGYNRRTFASISKQPDYKTWRDKRRTKAQKSAPAAKAVAAPQALESVAPPQSVTTPPKKPGHGRTVHRVVTRLGTNDDVTREEFDRVTGNMASQMNTLKLRCENLRRDVDILLKEDAAYREAEILLRDKSVNSPWERVKRAVKRGRR
ncbi:hypothetical protein [Dietzia natronolimnaea]|uniref:hypothetical protein n=1 Tax=Dietzia natronolimnaea TaxID=161920 RepID=UPI0015FB179D|nr:hypothetical protein [Dietzia natronolimnaea]MBB1037368.1 hypothetical protein [Dietzia natronolimnaea]